MVRFVINIFVAALMGFLAGMGVGGGSLLLLWLTQVTGLEPIQARLITLLFFLPAACVSTYFHRKDNQLDKKAAIAATITGCCAAVIFSMVSKVVNIDLLKKLFGGLLILTGIREIFYRPRNAR